VLADGYTLWQTAWQTDANRFCNLSHATLYDYGTDKNYEQKKSVKKNQSGGNSGGNWEGFVEQVGLEAAAAEWKVIDCKSDDNEKWMDFMKMLLIKWQLKGFFRF